MVHDLEFSWPDPAILYASIGDISELPKLQSSPLAYHATMTLVSVTVASASETNVFFSVSASLDAVATQLGHHSWVSDFFIQLKLVSHASQSQLALILCSACTFSVLSSGLEIIMFRRDREDISTNVQTNQPNLHRLC